MAKDPASRPPSASAFAAQLRAASEGELKPLAEGKIIANKYGNCFFPMLVACFAPYIPVMGGLYLRARAISPPDENGERPGSPSAFVARL